MKDRPAPQRPETHRRKRRKKICSRQTAPTAASPNTPQEPTPTLPGGSVLPNETTPTNNGAIAATQTTNTGMSSSTIRATVAGTVAGMLIVGALIWALRRMIKRRRQVLAGGQGGHPRVELSADGNGIAQPQSPSKFKTAASWVWGGKGFRKSGGAPVVHELQGTAMEKVDGRTEMPTPVSGTRRYTADMMWLWQGGETR